MFSLLITIISIVVVAGLALATLYYGGTAFGRGASRAEAAKIVLQGQQLLGASDLYFSDKHEWPAAISDLVSNGYLKQIPTAEASGLNAALAAGTTWTMPITKNPMFVTDSMSSADVCAEVNLTASLRKKGILKHAYQDLVAQCYGPDVPSLRTVFRKAADTLMSDGGAGLFPGDVLPTAPTDPGNTDWLVVPGATPPATPVAAPGAPAVEGHGGNGLYISKTVYDFGDVPVTAYGAFNVVVTNNSGSPVTFTEPGWDPYTFGPNYSVTGPVQNLADPWSALFYLEIDFGGTCDSAPGKALLPGASCTMYADFQPTVVGKKTWSTALHTSVGNFPLYFSGTGVAAGIQYGNAAVGGTVGTTVSVPTYLYPKGKDMRFVSWTADFPATEDTTTWALTGNVCNTSVFVSSIGNGTCILTLNFTPTQPTFLGHVTVKMVDANGVQYTATNTVDGTLSLPPLPGGLDVTPAVMTFPNVVVGQSAWVAPKVTNNTGQAVILSGVTVDNPLFTGTLAGDTPGCNTLASGLLVSGASCNFAVQFKPTAPGLVTAAVTISGTAYGQSFVAGLTVTGTGKTPPAGPWINDPLAGDAGTLLVGGPHRTLEGYRWDNSWNGNWSCNQLDGIGAFNIGGSCSYSDGIVDSLLPAADYFIEVQFDFTDNGQNNDDQEVYVYGRVQDYNNTDPNPFWHGFGSSRMGDVYLYLNRYDNYTNSIDTQISFGDQGGDAIPYIPRVKLAPMASGHHVFRVEYLGTRGRVLVDGQIATDFTMNYSTGLATRAGMGLYNQGAYPSSVKGRYFRVGPLAQLSDGPSMPRAALLPPPPPPPGSVNTPIIVNSYTPSQLGNGVYLTAPGWQSVSGVQTYYPNGAPYMVATVAQIGAGGATQTTLNGSGYTNLENTNTANAFYTYSDTCAQQPTIAQRNSCQLAAVKAQTGSSACSISTTSYQNNTGTQFTTVCTK